MMNKHCDITALIQEPNIKEDIKSYAVWRKITEIERTKKKEDEVGKLFI